MSDHLHVMIFRDLNFQVHIGCFPEERKNKQRIKIDLKASLRPIDDVYQDNPDQIIMDYAKISRFLENFFSQREFRLIETAAQLVMDSLLAHFPAEEMEVSLTKWPQDMPQGSSVTYIITQKRIH